MISPSLSACDAYRPMDGLAYLFIDFNAYFASVEQHDQPALRGRPVMVTPFESEHTGAIAASYEARAFGIGRGVTVRDARARCPDIAIMPARHDRYVQVHKLLMTEIERHLPLVKICSVDEAVFRLSPSERRPAPAIRTAQAIKKGIAENVGPSLRASIGLAPSRLLAKLAAERMKPDGLTVITPEDLPNSLHGIPLTDIPGVGLGVAARLQRAGVCSFMDLWRLQPKQARAIWGSVMGERFWYGLHGYDVPEEPTKKSMIGHSRVLTREHETPDRARIVARALLLKAASRLRHYGLYANRVSLTVRMRPDGTWDKTLGLAYTQDSFCFLRGLNVLWEQFLESWRRENSELRLGGVTTYLHGLAARDDSNLRQGDLFAAAHPNEDKHARLWNMVDQINADPSAKFRRLSGRNASGPPPLRKYVSLASQAGLDLNYLGGKIAFSRVPEEAEFLY